MISRVLGQRSSTLPLMRCFASEVATQSKTSAPHAEISQYLNGNLVKKHTLSLKKTEDIQGYVINIVKDYFRTTNKNGVTITSKLSDHGLDSLDSIELSMRIEEDLGYVISAETLPVLRSVKNFVTYIQHVENFKLQNNGQVPIA